MDVVEYQRFTDDLVAWADREVNVTGLIAVGSTAVVTHEPDERSDHDVLVVATAGASAAGAPCRPGPSPFRRVPDG
ncbi:MAG: hypothetical protein ACYCV4_17830, partial [Dermatophilaceae bacterium]